MTDYEKFSPGEVHDVITPDNEQARAIRNYIELLIDDDPSLGLESISAEELGRLDIRFIGWPHSSENVPYLFNHVREYNPHILIEESPGITADAIKRRELIYNLLMFGVPTHVGVEGEYSEAVIREEPKSGHELLMRLIRDSNIFPIYRQMDATAEQLEEIGFLGGEYPSTSQLYDVNWDFPPPDELKNNMGAALLADGYIDRTRESIMIDDVSRIAANSLAKLGGDIRVMVCFGSAHTSTARYFQKKGISADLRFLDEKTGELTTTKKFSRHHTLVREANLKRRLSEEYLRNYLLEVMLDMSSVLIRHNNGDTRATAEVADDNQKIIDSLIKNYGKEIWKEWEKVYSRRFLNRSMREKAHQKFVMLVETLIEEALDSTDFGSSSLR